MRDNSSRLPGARMRRGPRVAIARMVVGLVCLAGLAGCGSGPAASATPTIPPNPTATAAPPTPIPTALEQTLARLVQQDLGDLAASTTAAYDASAHTVMVQVTVPGNDVPSEPASVTAAQERSKTICFHAERVLWTSASTRGLALREVDTAVIGPLYDIYGDRTTGGYAAVTLTSHAESQFSWTTLTPDTAWDRYDFTFLRPVYNDAG